jgi:hypothetical protein
MMEAPPVEGMLERENVNLHGKTAKRHTWGRGIGSDCNFSATTTA